MLNLRKIATKSLETQCYCYKHYVTRDLGLVVTRGPVLIASSASALCGVHQLQRRVLDVLLAYTEEEVVVPPVQAVVDRLEVALEPVDDRTIGAEVEHLVADGIWRHVEQLLHRAVRRHRLHEVEQLERCVHRQRVVLGTCVHDLQNRHRRVLDAAKDSVDEGAGRLVEGVVIEVVLDQDVRDAVGRGLGDPLDAVTEHTLW